MGHNGVIGGRVCGFVCGGDRDYLSLVPCGECYDFTDEYWGAQCGPEVLSWWGRAMVGLEGCGCALGDGSDIIEDDICFVEVSFVHKSLSDFNYDG